ncbi:Verru_Chthon cassette protein D [Verrucomicrobium sp. GAS474]|uniref:Verru_Chthon cassette protein D n=1 Tax=Verrucomicrobium sp. GAS474 TaxID=1882831 RepID=UPI0008797D95|nr:Verru_Chthon cassette protein D [Verrucomicrobium sp. GAS474]SDT99097.1 Verru_Chthon cassette protein D [Verrucomicrobium sp. GAS474]
MNRLSSPSLPGSRPRRGFTLIELLVVMGIVAVVAVFAVPALPSLLLGNALSRGGQVLGNELALARQEAMTANREVEVRFYRISGSWTAVQAWRVDTDDSGTTYTPLRHIQYLPDGIIVKEGLSPLLTADPAVTGQVVLPARITASYGGFRFRPSGATSVAVTDANNFLTVQDRNAQGDPPKNYYTLQVNPLSGKIAVYRP